MLGRDLGVHGAQRRVAVVGDDELEAEAVVVGEAQRAVAAGALVPGGGEARGPEVQRGSEATPSWIVWIIPAPARPGRAPANSNQVRIEPGEPASSPKYRW